MSFTISNRINEGASQEIRRAQCSRAQLIGSLVAGDETALGRIHMFAFNELFHRNPIPFSNKESVLDAICEIQVPSESRSEMKLK